MHGARCSFAPQTLSLHTWAQSITRSVFGSAEIPSSPLNTALCAQCECMASATGHILVAVQPLHCHHQRTRQLRVASHGVDRGHAVAACRGKAPGCRPQRYQTTASLQDARVCTMNHSVSPGSGCVVAVWAGLPLARLSNHLCPGHRALPCRHHNL